MSTLCLIFRNILYVLLVLLFVHYSSQEFGVYFLHPSKILLEVLRVMLYVTVNATSVMEHQSIRPLHIWMRVTALWVINILHVSPKFYNKCYLCFCMNNVRIIAFNSEHSLYAINGNRIFFIWFEKSVKFLIYPIEKY